MSFLWVMIQPVVTLAWLLHMDFDRKHLKACEKNRNWVLPNAPQLLSCAPPREDAGVAERDGFEIRCVSDST